VDENLYHDIITGRSVTGILHLCNQPLIESFSKLDSYLWIRICCCKDCCRSDCGSKQYSTLPWLPVQERSFRFGDNQAVVNNSAILNSTLSKRHNALSYRRVREAIATGMVNFYWIDGKSNPGDIVSKHWAYPQVWYMLQPILFDSGDTNTLLKYSDPTS
jgi:hypothetical protein